jgi:hypothetical protein
MQVKIGGTFSKSRDGLAVETQVPDIVIVFHVRPAAGSIFTTTGFLTILKLAPAAAAAAVKAGRSHRQQLSHDRFCR